MKNLKSLFAVFALTAALIFSTTAANAGIIVAGATENPNDTPCTDSSSSLTLKGIIVAGFTGIIVAGNTEFCGIIVAG
jgi:hypothetical protein